MIDYFQWLPDAWSCEHLYFYCTLQRLLYAADPALWAELQAGVSSIERIESHHGSGTYDISWAAVEGRTGSAIIVAGTTALVQGLHQGALMLNLSYAPYPGLVAVYDAAVEEEINDRVMGRILFGLRPPITTCGHSLGGSVAQLLAHRIQLQFPGKLYGCLTFGSKKVGDQAFCDGTTFPLYQVANSRDPVPKLCPPDTIFVPVPKLPRRSWPPEMTRLLNYRYAGTYFVLDIAGDMWVERNYVHVGIGHPMQRSIETPASFDELLAHSSTEYARRLRRRLYDLTSPSGLRAMQFRPTLDRINLELNRREGIVWIWDPETGLPLESLIEPWLPAAVCGCRSNQF